MVFLFSWKEERNSTLSTFRWLECWKQTCFTLKVSRILFILKLHLHCSITPKIEASLKKSNQTHGKGRTNSGGFSISQQASQFASSKKTQTNKPKLGIGFSSICQIYLVYSPSLRYTCNLPQTIHVQKQASVYFSPAGWTIVHVCVCMCTQECAILSLIQQRGPSELSHFQKFNAHRSVFWEEQSGESKFSHGCPLPISTKQLLNCLFAFMAIHLLPRLFHAYYLGVEPWNTNIKPAFKKC